MTLTKQQLNSLKTIVSSVVNKGYDFNSAYVYQDCLALVFKKGSFYYKSVLKVGHNKVSGYYSADVPEGHLPFSPVWTLYIRKYLDDITTKE